ncbi:MAG: RpiB/LacA/LacB family sugar-phosphate isomerase, partial [Cyanobacteria bacterium J06639_14]
MPQSKHSLLEITIMHIALGANRPGFFLKEAIKDHLLCQGHELEDTGISAYDAEVPYYQVAAKVA